MAVARIWQLRVWRNALRWWSIYQFRRIWRIGQSCSALAIGLESRLRLGLWLGLGIGLGSGLWLVSELGLGLRNLPNSQRVWSNARRVWSNADWPYMARFLFSNFTEHMLKFWVRLVYLLILTFLEINLFSGGRMFWLPWFWWRYAVFILLENFFMSCLHCVSYLQNKTYDWYSVCMQAKAVDKMRSERCFTSPDIRVVERSIWIILRLHFWSLVTDWLCANDNIYAAKLRM